MTYAAPTREMLFVMKEIGGLDAVLQQPGHEEVDPDLVDAILGEAGKFATDVLAPLNQPGDRQGRAGADAATHALVDVIGYFK